jgi:hypothetical protein
MNHENVEASRLQPGGLGGRAEFRISVSKISKAVLPQAADRPQAISVELTENSEWVDWPPADGGTS